MKLRNTSRRSVTHTRGPVFKHNYRQDRDGPTVPAMIMSTTFSAVVSSLVDREAELPALKYNDTPDRTLAPRRRLLGTFWRPGMQSLYASRCVRRSIQRADIQHRRGIDIFSTHHESNAL